MYKFSRMSDFIQLFIYYLVQLKLINGKLYLLNGRFQSWNHSKFGVSLVFRKYCLGKANKYFTYIINIVDMS